MNAAPAPLRRWLRPPLSREHGATITLLVSFFTGAWLAGRWNTTTSLALLAAVAAFQTQAPLARMLRRRATDGPSALWLTLYAGVAAVAATKLWLTVPALGRIYAVAGIGLLINLIGILRRDPKSAVNELAAFFTLALALPLAFTATSGFMAEDLLGLWLLMALVMSSSVFTVQIRLQGDPAITAAVVYHLVALSSIFLLVRLELLEARLSWAMLIPVTKLVLIMLQFDRYRKMKLTHIGLGETALAMALGSWIGIVAG